MNKENLIEFENEIASIFNEGKIRAPIHLYSGNEDFLINFFKRVNPQDWVMCSDIDILKLKEPNEIYPAYEKAYLRDDGKSTILVEYGDFYNEK